MKLIVHGVAVGLGGGVFDGAVVAVGPPGVCVGGTVLVRVALGGTTVFVRVEVGGTAVLVVQAPVTMIVPSISG